MGHIVKKICMGIMAVVSFPCHVCGWEWQFSFKENEDVSGEPTRHVICFLHVFFFFFPHLVIHLWSLSASAFNYILWLNCCHETFWVFVSSSFDDVLLNLLFGNLEGKVFNFHWFVMEVIICFDGFWWRLYLLRVSLKIDQNQLESLHSETEEYLKL